jgi:hypothetical protein
MLRFPVLAVQPYEHIVRALALNYCKNCRRHLNGAVSCPGCGATGLELAQEQDGRSTLRLPSVDSDTGATRNMSAPKSAGGGRRGIPVGDDSDDNDDRDGGRRSHAATDEARRSRADRRGEKRHGIGLMLTGGFAGIIVVAFLLYGNAGGGGDGAPAGSVVAAGPTGSATASAASLTVAASATGPATFQEATSASASPTHTASASPSKSATPEQTATSAAPGRSATATATRTTASAAPTSASPTKADPTPSTTKSSCWLIFCS